MNAKDFKALCMAVSLLKPGIQNIKHVPDVLCVEYKGILYYPEAYVMTFENGEKIHQGQLHDLQTNSVVLARLDSIKRAVSA